MTTQRTFITDGLSERYSLPESLPKAKPSPHTDAEEFAKVHPWFVEWIIGHARKRKSEGSTRWSMKAAFELARHLFLARFGVAIPGVGRVGLNNNLTASMTRLIEKRAPDLAGFFRQRERPSERK